eukprot:TRINITY_DN3715_c0_g1_i1.p1 TRINITY_DN3715_c0_g1~~TRINITY_DN3715_c0_g1_i1.p1  ORF type:complete len:199 (-),score=10.79 TRINITY_DN3715_c0_g1_i1:61-657(-)
MAGERQQRRSPAAFAAGGLATSAGTPRGLRTAPAMVFRANSAFKAPLCPNGHCLYISVCRVGTQVCNRCQRRIESTATHRCRACDYDLCRRCFTYGPHAQETDNVSTTSKDDAYFGFLMEDEELHTLQEAGMVSRAGHVNDRLSHGGRGRGCGFADAATDVSTFAPIERPNPALSEVVALALAKPSWRDRPGLNSRRR